MARDQAGDADYRESHRDPAKGEQYEQYYATDPWSKYVWGREQEILRRVLTEYFAGKEVHHLDFACGTGRIIEFMSGHTTESTGVDVSPSMLAEARGKGIDARLIEADITDSDELAGETFNLITAFRFFLNAEPELRASAITALGKRLAPDGVLVFNNHHNSGSPYVEMVRLTRGFNAGLNVWNVMSLREMRDLADLAGLEIVEVLSAGLLRVPKIHFSESTLAAWDDAAMRHPSLRRFSEDLVAVCVPR